MEINYLPVQPSFIVLRLASPYSHAASGSTGPGSKPSRQQGRSVQSINISHPELVGWYEEVASRHITIDDTGMNARYTNNSLPSKNGQVLGARSRSSPRPNLGRTTGRDRTFSSTEYGEEPP